MRAKPGMMKRQRAGHATRADADGRRRLSFSADGAGRQQAKAAFSPYCRRLPHAASTWAAALAVSTALGQPGGMAAASGRLYTRA